MGLEGTRLIYVATRAGSTGVGDYAEDFVAAVRPYFAEVVELRHGGPGEEGWRDIRRLRRRLRALLADGAPTIVHTELAGGSVTSFWVTAGLGSVPVTATVHDPPRVVWWPLRTRGVARWKLLNHGVHVPFFGLFGALERRVQRGRTLFVLSAKGAHELRRAMPGSRIVESRLIAPERPQLAPVPLRPKAIGLFGYVYRGKGFDVVADLRRALDDDVSIRIAGRGTERLPATPGVEVLGEVDGAEEDAFFGSIRALLVPYPPRVIYGLNAYPAASTVSRAIAYRTPIIARTHGALAELQDSGAAVLVDGQGEELAAAAQDLLGDDARLAELEAAAERTRRAESADAVARLYVAEWERLS